MFGSKGISPFSLFLFLFLFFCFSFSVSLFFSSKTQCLVETYYRKQKRHHAKMFGAAASKNEAVRVSGLRAAGSVLFWLENYKICNVLHRFNFKMYAIFRNFFAFFQNFWTRSLFFATIFIEFCTDFNETVSELHTQY